MQIVLILISSAAVLTAFLFLIFDVYVVIIGHLRGAPFVPSSKKRVRAMIEIAELKPEEIVVDLGSGNGKILFATAKLGCQAVGVEINPFLVWYTRLKAKRLGVSDQVKVFRKDFRKYSLVDADVIFVYLWPETITNLISKFTAELKPEARIISNAFSLSGITPLKTSDNIFLYKTDNLKKRKIV